MQHEELVPGAELMESMRAVGYSLKTAVADLCDNSIAAEAANIAIHWQLQPVPYFYLLDDGRGMTQDELRQAMRLAGKSSVSRRDEFDLGRFGLGLKTASMSQARCLTVVTKQGKSIFAAKWDLDYLLTVGTWNLLWLDETAWQEIPGFNELDQQTSGTLVHWSALDQLLDGKASDQASLASEFEEVSSHLGLVFHRFTAPKAKQLKISINGAQVPQYDPFLEGGVGVVDKGVTNVSVAGQTVTVQPFILPSLSAMSRHQREKALFDASKMREAQGFYIYRNKRLLAWGTWFRLAPMDESGRLARVRVDTGNELDAQWKLGIMKSTVQPPKALLEALKRLVPNIVDNSHRAVNRRSTVRANSTGQIWNIKALGDGAFSLEANSSHPMFMQLFDRLEADEQRLFSTYVDVLAKYIPAEELHRLLAQDQNVREGLHSDEEIRSLASTLFDALLPSFSGNEDLTWQAVENIEPFQSDTQLKSRLRALREESKS